MALAKSTRFHRSDRTGNVVIDGLDVVVDDLDRASRLAGLRASRVVTTTAKAMAETMRSMAPVASGRLQRSIEATALDGGRLGLGDLEAEIGPTAFYGHIVERGSVRTSPRPFVEPAGDMHAAAFEAALERVAGDV